MFGLLALLVFVAAVDLEYARACQPLLQPAHLRDQQAQKQAVLSTEKEERVSYIQRFGGGANITEIECIEEGNCTTDADCLGGVCRTDSNTCRCACDIGRRCELDTQCGLGGVCGGDVPGVCVCGCVHLRHCKAFGECGGRNKNSCVSKCVAKNGIAETCDSKTTCARGTQCLSGVCIGGGKLLDNGQTVGVSCTFETAASDCAGIGSQTCTQEKGVCIQDVQGVLIGQFNCTSEGVSAAFGFPTCVSGQKQAIACGDGLMCARGAQCGLCDCNL